MPVFMIIDIKIKKPNLYSEYIEKVSKIIKKFGGKYLVRGGKITELARDWTPERIIIIEFESAEKVHECLSSEEYQKIASLRYESTDGKAIIVEGV
jgi:uncharacterized protein (DUF1330 family)